MKTMPLFLILFSLISLSFSQGAYAAQNNNYLQDFDRDFMRCASVLVSSQSTPGQIEEAQFMIEELAVSGHHLSFNMLWDFKKGGDPVKAKAEFVRDFLACDLHSLAITNVSNKIIDYQNTFPSFLTILQELINQDPEKETINFNFKPILKTLIFSLPNMLQNPGHEGF